ncbi:hypothetical protein BC938DRAFT_484078 [Jimgerdemannia flammicorona]|uniref:Protein kinase domain-containing protein n=1 Tax=Jimgerdemannia flammicorona TaxID=994334 RepID=A0A433QAR5_9FUNG|nr:hypothetical protein BC938DRAFT_484078 [Jimgerdemannia flammicorona]
MLQDRIQLALSLLKPFNQLRSYKQSMITSLKNQFPYEDKLTEDLEHLGLLKLAEYLVWIPLESFTDLRPLGKGGFATVWLGNIKPFKNKGNLQDEPFALKEVGISMLQEVSRVRVPSAHDISVGAIYSATIIVANRSCSFRPT